MKYRLLKEGNTISSNVISPFINAALPGTSDWSTIAQTRMGLTFQEAPPIFAIAGLDFQQLKYNDIVLTLDRPLLYRIVFPLTLSAMVLFIALLALVESLDAFLAGSIAILFGVFGIKQALIPPNMQSHTILDVAILGFYVLLVFVSLQFAVTALLKRPKS